MPVPPNLVTVPNQTPDHATGPAQAAPVDSGGHCFDPDAIQPVIDRLWAVVDGELAGALQHAQCLAAIEPPGLEEASEAFAADAKAHGESYGTYLDLLREGLTAYVVSLEQARDSLLDREDDAVVAVTGMSVTSTEGDA